MSQSDNGCDDFLKDKMITDDESMSAEEKIKQLMDNEEEGLKELDEKKKELEKKKKELEELERKKEEEKEAARKELKEQIAELALEEKKRFQELEKLRREREKESSLEDTVTEEKPKKIPVQTVKPYGQIFEELKSGAPNFYDVTNYNVLERLEEIAGEANSRALTKSEEDFVNIVEYHAKKFGRDDFYKDKDEANYLTRELSKIDHINKMAKEKNDLSESYKTDV